MKITLNFKDVMRHGLPEGSCIFLWDGNIYEGWTLSNIKAGIPIQNHEEIEWEVNEGPTLMGARYWAKIPDSLKELDLD
jgi:hypothetical protein